MRLAQCELLTRNLIRMSKRCKLQKEYYQQYGNYKGNGKYCDKYVSWLENEVLALRQPLVISSFCKCKGGAVGRTVTADFEHQICDRCGNIAK